MLFLCIYMCRYGYVRIRQKSRENDKSEHGKWKECKEAEAGEGVYQNSSQISSNCQYWSLEAFYKKWQKRPFDFTTWQKLHLNLKSYLT